MKKIIITIIFFLNILPSISKKQVGIVIGHKVYAQCTSTTVGYGTYNSSSASGGGTTSSWWSVFTGWLSGIPSTIGSLFGNTIPPPHYTGPFGGFGGSIYPYGYFNQNPYNNGGGGGSNNPSGIVDCQGLDGGTAHIDVCGACVAGYTGLAACNAPTTNDTLKPIKIPCPTDAVARDLRSDSILDFIKDSAITVNARDSAPFRDFEVSFAISKTTIAAPTGTTYKYRPRNYNKTGAAQSAIITYTQSSVADLHVHPDSISSGTKNCQSPSPRDYMVLLKTTLILIVFFIMTLILGM